MPDENTVPVCPACDTTDIHPRGGSLDTGGTDEKPSWWCRTCGTDFDDPVRRAPRSERTRKGTAWQLLQADPEEVFGDD